MSIFETLNTLILKPLELLFDVIYAKAYQITGNPGLSIIFLSLAINMLVFPLYRRADAIQQEEHLKSDKMQPGIDHINKVFKGDERFMILQTYYRQNNYKPYYVLKGSISLLLQIPFFIAAYRYLSGLSLLKGVSFGPIADLGMPDDLLRIGGYSFHLLPILMTLINLISGAIYTRGMPLKSKIQTYGITFVFLVLLYESPSGLVFYWTLNNVFSLVKNMFSKLPNPGKVLSVLSSLAGIVLLGTYLITHHNTRMGRIVYVILAALLLQIPLLLQLLHNRTSRFRKFDNIKVSPVIFYSCCIFMTVLTGILIPSTIINASPSEFVELIDFHNPLRYVVHSGLIAAGFFLVWVGVYYHLFSQKPKNMFTIGMLLVSVCSVIDYMFFGKNFGNISSTLIYDEQISVSQSTIINNSIILIAAAVIILLILAYKADIIRAICLAGCLAISVMSVQNIIGINKDSSELKLQAEQLDTEIPSFALDQKGKNVVVIMLDRGLNAFVPYLLEENKTLAKQFQGFTYYPNAFSFGNFTNIAVPSLFGGYEYMPFEINKRADESLKDKHNEALKVMPIIFMQNGFEVTVCDPPYANYKSRPDLSIFDEYPEIHRYITNGVFTKNEQELIDINNHTIYRNLFCYSIFRIVPSQFSKSFYEKGNYNEAATYAEAKNNEDGPKTAYKAQSLTQSIGSRSIFLKTYYALENLNYMTRITDSGKNTYFSINNNTTHDVMMLQEPQFEPAPIVDNTEYEAAHKIRASITGDEMELETIIQMEHYQVNMAAFIKLGNWFDYLRENNVWDNTRIILVSDHGRSIGLDHIITGAPESENDDYTTSHPDYHSVMYFNPLLMIKDFNSREFKIDYTFMTNADTPTEAFRDLISNPINPFTGNEITNERKHDPELYAMDTNFRIKKNNGNTFTDPIKITLRNHNVFEIDNWTFGE